MGKKLSEAAADILAANLKSKGTVSGKGGEQFGLGKQFTADQDKQGEVELNKTALDSEKDKLYDPTKGVPTATPPGQTPPVGSEKDGVGYTKPEGQPGETQGRTDLANLPIEQEVDAYGELRDRIAGKRPKQTFEANPNAVTAPVAGESIKEDIAAMLAGENLSEAFIEKATTIFEAAVSSRVEQIAEGMEEALVEEFETAIEGIKEDIAGKMNSYLDYVVEAWVDDNKIAIDTGLRSEVVEGFIGALKTVFEEHYIDIPEEKVDVVSELAEKVQHLENQVNEEISKNIKLKKEISEQKKIEAAHTVCEGLTLSQVEKIKSIAKGMEFTTEDEFTGKLTSIKESYYPSGKVIVPNSNALNDQVIMEDTDDTITKSQDPMMDLYAKTITRTIAKQ